MAGRSVAASTRSGSAARSAYQRIKEKLVSLTVELDDRTHAAEILSQSIYQERAGSREELERLNEQWQSRHERERNQRKQALEAALERADELVAEKKSFARGIQDALDASKKASDTTTNKVRKITDEGSAELTKARAAWKSGEAARRAKFMERKAKEARALTLKGLQPEMQRLEDKQRRLLADLAEALDRGLREIADTTLAEDDAAAANIRAEYAMKARGLVDKEAVVFRRRLDELADQHETRLRETRSQLEAEAEAARRDDREEIRQLHAAMDHELRVARNAADDRFEAFRKQHAKELAELEAVHRRAEAKLTSEALLERDAWENKTRSRLTGQRSAGDGNERAGADDAACDVAGGAGATGLAPRLTDFERAQAAAEVEREEAQMRADRDSEIEGFIRTLQTRSMARAVELREKFAADDQKYTSVHAVKCQELRESKADWHARHVESQQAQQRLREHQRDARQKLRQLQSQSRHMADLASDISSALTMATVDHALDGAAELDDDRNGSNSAELGSNGAGGHAGVVKGAAGSSREQARAHEAEISSAMAQLDELEAECRRQREAEAEAVKSRQDEHSRTLHALNDSVRVSVAERQDEVAALEDALEAERARGDKLADMIDAYETSTIVSGTTAANSTDANARAARANRTRGRGGAGGGGAEVADEGRDAEATDAGDGGDGSSNGGGRAAGESEGAGGRGGGGSGASVATSATTASRVSRAKQGRPGSSRASAERSKRSGEGRRKAEWAK